MSETTLRWERQGRRRANLVFEKGLVGCYVKVIRRLDVMSMVLKPSVNQV